VISVENKVFLKGELFNAIYEVFKENIRSGERFVLKDHNYLKKISQIKVFFDKEAFENVLKIVEEDKNINTDQIWNEIQKNIRQTDELRKELSSANQSFEKNNKTVLSELNKEKYLNFLNENTSLSSYNENKEYFLNKYINYLFNE
jgi:hypothetical protein